MFNDELSILALYGLLVALTVLLQTTGLMGQLGMGYLMSARDENREAAGMTARLERALNNSVVAMTLFAPAILIIAIRDGFSDTTLMAAQIFLLARVVYLPAYALGIMGLRTLVWLAGFAATAVLYFQAL
ncbi:MAG: MAPEG family protein [Paracoccaceae bacterium]